MVMNLDLRELEEFGWAADRLQQPALAEGGFLVPGAGSAVPQSRRREDGDSHVGREPRAEEARPATGSRQGRSAPSTAAGAAAHPVERGLTAVLRLEELFTWHPDAQWVDSSSGYALLLVPLGLFRTIPERAYLLLEIPTHEPAWLRGKPAGYAPFIRAWARWSFGLSVRAHHEYPDRSVCVCREEDWVLGRHVIEDYVGYCASWMAKALHERLLGWWPGLQHCPAAIRVERGRPYEYCGCGKPTQYHRLLQAQRSREDLDQPRRRTCGGGPEISTGDCPAGPLAAATRNGDQLPARRLGPIRPPVRSGTG